MTRLGFRLGEETKLCMVVLNLEQPLSVIREKRPRSEKEGALFFTQFNIPKLDFKNG
jgi:hypothetical protein